MSEELKHMGTPEQARAALIEKARAWRALRQPVMGTAKQIKEIEAADNEGRFQLANAALLWLWHAENATPTPEGGGEELAARLLRTTEAMASLCTAPQDLWNEHSNACLEAARLLSSPRVEEAIPFNMTDLAQLQQVREELRNRWRASAWQLLCRTLDDLEARAALSLQVG